MNTTLMLLFCTGILCVTLLVCTNALITFKDPNEMVPLPPLPCNEYLNDGEYENERSK